MPPSSPTGEVVEKVAADSSIRRGDPHRSRRKAFVAGADISELSQCDAGNAERLSRTGSRIFRAYEMLLKPVIAAINGFALGGGCDGLPRPARQRERQLGQPEVKLGTSPGYGGTVRLPRLIGRGRATEQDNDAAEAYRIGLVNRVVRRISSSPAEEHPRSSKPEPSRSRPAWRSWTSRSTCDDALEVESKVFGDLAGSERGRRRGRRRSSRSGRPRL